MMVVVVSTNISSKLGIHFWHTTTGNCQSILNKQKFRYMKKKPTVIYLYQHQINIELILGIQ
jgi:thermostable 8-oxoguanine DNA glycosylase